MTTKPQRIALFMSVALAACAVAAPPDPRELDCATLDRAAERFPEECGEPESDAAASADAAVDDGGLHDGGL